MPLYEYQCGGQCGRFEIIQKFSDAPLQTCPTCGQEVQKLLSSPAIQFKGTGWYITDYARRSSGGKPEGGKSEGGKSESKDSGSKESGTTKDSGTKASDSSSSSSSKTKND